MLNRYAGFFLPLASGLLLWAAWPVSPFTFLIFIALVPFLYNERSASSSSRFFAHVYLMLLVWNTGTTWWVCNSTLPGGVVAIIANSLLMSVPWMGYYHVQKRAPRRVAYITLIACWLSFEYLHLNWELSWPWLTLGNVFASHPDWVQWYQYTGTSGGSLWVLCVNILVADGLIAYKAKILISWRNGILAAVALVMPFFISFLAVRTWHDQPVATRQVMIVQPDIDPYEKFREGMQDAQIHKLIAMSEKSLDSTTSLVVWPETALNLPHGIDETQIGLYPELAPLRQFLSTHPRVKLLTGIESYQLYSENSRSETSRFLANLNQYYDGFNTASLFGPSGAEQLYHKSKFVPGVEFLPGFLRFLDTWFEKFGGTGVGYSPQADRTVISDPRSGLRIAPSICYESIYGEFMTAYMRNGANIICIITNDGWWANTQGHKQHMQYARLRAIESRRWVLRSANTGISCIIGPDGTIYQPRAWDTAATIKMNVALLTGQTFYVQVGDIISKLAVVLALLLALLFCIQRIRRINKK